eukprot:1307494-Rhodomonas_salina.1
MQDLDRRDRQFDLRMVAQPDFDVAFAGAKDCRVRGRDVHRAAVWRDSGDKVLSRRRGSHGRVWEARAGGRGEHEHWRVRG